jgi:hypothetical protein
MAEKTETSAQSCVSNDPFTETGKICKIHNFDYTQKNTLVTVYLRF